MLTSKQVEIRQHSTRIRIKEEDKLYVNRNMLEAAQMIVLTGNIKTAAKKVGIEVQTLREWLRTNEEFKEVLNEFTNVALAEMRSELIGASREALIVMRDIMKDDAVDAKERIKAAVEVMDRAGINVEKKQKVEVTNNHNFSYYSQLKDDELDKIIDVDFTEG